MNIRWTLLPAFFALAVLNCEYQAVHMEYSKETLIGFKTFLEQHHIELYLPRNCRSDIYSKVFKTLF